MAVRKKTTTTKRKTAAKPATRKKKTTAATTRRTRKSAGGFVNFFVPFFFIVCILFCLGFLGFMGYRTVTASEFFDVEMVDIRGAETVNKTEIERIVRSQTEKTGVWQADLKLLKEEIEALTHVKTASVSRILPHSIRVDLDERVPVAVVRIDGGDFWADADGIVLGEVDKSKEYPSFVIYGWERDKNEGAQKNNKERVEMYAQMLEEWRELELDRRVVAVDLTDLQEPKAIAKDSEQMVSIEIKKRDFGKNLQSGLKAIAGKGESFKAVDYVGQNIRLIPRSEEN